MHWSKEEKEILCDLYPKEGLSKNLEILLKRSKQAILHKASKLKLTKSSNWSENEDKMLKYYYDFGIWDLGKPKRSISAIHNRAVFLKLRCSDRALKEINKNNIIIKDYNLCYGYGKIIGGYIVHCKSGAVSRGLECPIFDGSLESAKFLDSIAFNFCSLSGLPITYKIYSRQTGTTASLDRIDSSKGYTKENVRWIHKDLNRIKSDYSDEMFIKYCNAVCEFNKNKK